MNIRVPARLPDWNGIVYSGRGMSRGLGQDDDSGDYTDMPVVTPPSYGGTGIDLSSNPLFNPTSTQLANESAGIAISPTPGTSSGVNNSQLTASTINTLVTAGTQIGKTLAAEAAAPGSQLVYNAQGQLVAATSLPSTSTLTSLLGSSSNMLIYVALAALAFMALEKH